MKRKYYTKSIHEFELKILDLARYLLTSRIPFYLGLFVLYSVLILVVIGLINVSFKLDCILTTTLTLNKMSKYN